MSLALLLPYHQLQRHFNISRDTEDGSPLHITSNRAQTGNLWFLNASYEPLSYAPSGVKINTMVLKLWESFDCQLKNLIFYKTYHKIFLSHTEKRNGSVFFILCCSILTRRSLFKEPPSFWVTHTCTDLISRKHNMQSLEKIWTNQLEVRRCLV